MKVCRSGKFSGVGKFLRALLGLQWNSCLNQPELDWYRIISDLK